MADEVRTNPEELTVDQLKEQLAQAKAENAKLGAETAKQKNRIDELCSNEGKLKKALREKQTAEEQEAAAKQEKEEAEKVRVSKLERELGIMKAATRYAKLGFGDQSEQMATFEYDRDMDAWTDAVDKHMAAYKVSLKKLFVLSTQRRCPSRLPATLLPWIIQNSLQMHRHPATHSQSLSTSVNRRKPTDSKSMNIKFSH